MRAVIQRVSKAKVSVKAKIIGQIGSGLLVFIAIHKDDDQKDKHAEENNQKDQQED